MTMYRSITMAAPSPTTPLYPSIRKRNSNSRSSNNNNTKLDNEPDHDDLNVSN